VLRQSLHHFTNKLEEELMAGPCLTTAPTLADPLTVNAKPGQINLKLTGTVVFDPSGTDVITTSGAKVSFTCSAQTLSFTGVSGTSYYVEMLHAGTMATSTGDLQEDCAGAVTLATLSPANTFSRLLVVVA
jgi:hypothetical protein